MLASVWENYPISLVTEEQIASIKQITFVRPFLRRQGDWIRLAGKTKRRHGCDSLGFSLILQMSWFKRNMWAASSLTQQLRTFSHAGRGPQAYCTLPVQAPAANNSQSAFDSNPNLSYQQGLKDPATAVQGSWWWLSSAVPGDLETQWFAKHEEMTADFQQHSRKPGTPKAPTLRHLTEMALAEEGLGSRGTFSP